MCVPSLNKIHKIVFELSHTQLKSDGGGGSVRYVKPVYPKLSFWDIISTVTHFGFPVKTKRLTITFERA